MTATRQEAYEKFWRTLLERSRSKTSLFAGVLSPRHGNQLATTMGKRAYVLKYIIRGDEGAVRLHLQPDDKRAQSGWGSKEVFDTLYSEREAIEKELEAISKTGTK